MLQQIIKILDIYLVRSKPKLPYFYRHHWIKHGYRSYLGITSMCKVLFFYRVLTVVLVASARSVTVQQLPQQILPLTSTLLHTTHTLMLPLWSLIQVGSRQIILNVSCHFQESANHLCTHNTVLPAPQACSGLTSICDTLCVYKWNWFTDLPKMVVLAPSLHSFWTFKEDWTSSGLGHDISFWAGKDMKCDFKKYFKIVHV